MAGTKNGVLVAKNADFTQSIGPNAQSSESNGLISDGQLWIGTDGGKCRRNSYKCWHIDGRDRD